MFPFSSILCPIDFDQGSFRALSVASELAHDGNSTLYLLHVVALRSGFDPLSVEMMETAVRMQLQRIVHQKLKAGARYDLLVRRGDPAAQVMQMADELRVDLIVMATHGRRGLRRLVLGSVAERVVREARCPVLTVKAPAARRGASGRRPRRKRGSIS